jgi:hypothetical protein
MTQLEFQQIVDGLPVCPAARPRRAARKLLVFVREFVERKFRHGLTDVDLLILTALAHCAVPPRFVQVMDLARGVSQSGTWNSLERLEGHGLIAVGGPPLAHTYRLSDEGIKVLAHLAGKR